MHRPPDLLDIERDAPGRGHDPLHDLVGQPAAVAEAATSARTSSSSSGSSAEPVTADVGSQGASNSGRAVISTRIGASGDRARAAGRGHRGWSGRTSGGPRSPGPAGRWRPSATNQATRPRWCARVGSSRPMGTPSGPSGSPRRLATSSRRPGRPPRRPSRLARIRAEPGRVGLGADVQRSSSIRLDDRPEHAHPGVGGARGGLHPDAGPVGRRQVAELRRQAGLAHPGLPGDQDRRPVCRPGPGPTGAGEHLELRPTRPISGLRRSRAVDPRPEPPGRSRRPGRPRPARSMPRSC